MMKLTAFCISVVGSILLFPGAVGAQDKEHVNPVSLTIYNGDFAIVRERRQMSFEQGINPLEVTEIASRIRPESVGFTCLSDPDAIRILEQNYEYDLLGIENLLDKYIGERVCVTLSDTGASKLVDVQGVLMSSSDDGLILHVPGKGFEIVNRYSISGISLQGKVDSLITKPTLLWLAEADQAGQQECEISYLTYGISWDADYRATLSQDDQSLELSAWVTINNRSGKAYSDAQIKLMAGDVEVERETFGWDDYEDAMYCMASAPPSYESREKPFLDYHLYSLARPSTIKNKQVKQVQLFQPVSKIGCVKKYCYKTSIEPYLLRADPEDGMKHPEVLIEFSNSPENRLGIPLPAGTIQTFKVDSDDGQLEFVGEDAIPHTPKGEDVSLMIGYSFDIIVEDKLLDEGHQKAHQQVNRPNRAYKNQDGDEGEDDDRLITRELTVKNHKKEKVEIVIDELVPKGYSWETQSEQEFQRIDSRTARSVISVDAESETTIQYTMWLRR